MRHTDEAVGEYLKRIQEAWNAPEDFWIENSRFYMDSHGLKQMLTKAYLEGYFEARLNYETTNLQSTAQES